MQRAAFKVALTAIAVAAAFASTAHAAGFMLTEQSAGSLGRAYAGAGVDGTDLSGVYYNPATMVLHKGTSIQMGFVGVGLNLDYVGEDGTTANGRNKSQAIPHGYIVHQINDKAWFGLGMTVPFGMGTEYDENWAGNQHGISATILTYDFNPNFAFKLHETFSVGFGASVQYAKADLTIRKALGSFVPTVPGYFTSEIKPELPPRCRDYAVGAFRTYSLAHFTPRSLYICRCSFTGSPGMTTFSKTFAF